jgi:predicted metal-dependent enzyme (double-stranded beta helix superfamily)
MLSDIHAAVTTVCEDRAARVAKAIQCHLHEPGLIAPEGCPSCPNGYIRHLLHADCEFSYAVVALVWRPGQMSPVHAHRTWCALGVYRGALTEGYYAAPEGSASPRQTGSLLRGAGAVSHGPADLSIIHRLANLSTNEATSIHVYGARFDRFGEDVNHVF